MADVANAHSEPTLADPQVVVKSEILLQTFSTNKSKFQFVVSEDMWLSMEFARESDNPYFTYFHIFSTPKFFFP